MDAILEKPKAETKFTSEIPVENYKSRLAKYLTGIPLEETDLLVKKVMEDKQRFHEELGFPQIELLVENPVEYKKVLIRIAKDKEIKIISVDEVPDWVLEVEPTIRHMRDQPSVTSGCYCEEIDSIVSGDLESIDPKVISILAHELVHAIDYKNMKMGGLQSMAIEQLEYRAYLLSGFSKEKMSSKEAPMYIRGLFGDGKIVGSSFGYYFDKSIRDGVCTDFSDFLKKSREGVVKIPWYGPRESSVVEDSLNS